MSIKSNRIYYNQYEVIAFIPYAFNILQLVSDAVIQYPRIINKLLIAETKLRYDIPESYPTIIPLESY